MVDYALKRGRLNAHPVNSGNDGVHERSKSRTFEKGKNKMRLGIAFAAFLLAGCADVKEGLKEGFIPGYAFNKQLNQIRENGEAERAREAAQHKERMDYFDKEMARIRKEPVELQEADLQRLERLTKEWIAESDSKMRYLDERGKALDRQMDAIDRQMEADEIRDSIDDLTNELRWEELERQSAPRTLRW
jgi:hypothetical protein